MSPSLVVIGNEIKEFQVAEREREQRIREQAAHDGLRLEKSRRVDDLSYGPTLYWLVDVTTGTLVTSRSGERLEALHKYLLS